MEGGGSGLPADGRDEEGRWLKEAEVGRPLFFVAPVA